MDEVEAALGLRDEACVQREAFAQWVIEDDLPEDRPDWAGAGATITDDVHAFEATKLRILNGAHSTLTYLGLLAGHASVGEAVADPVLRAFVDRLIREESIPSITAPEGLSLPEYWEATLARFDNPHIVHRLEQISHDGSQKIPARILPVLAHDGNARRAAFVCAPHGWSGRASAGPRPCRRPMAGCATMRPACRTRRFRLPTMPARCSPCAPCSPQTFPPTPSHISPNASARAASATPSRC